MKVHVLTATRHWGGLETHTCGLAAALQARGHDVTIVELGRGAFAHRPAARALPAPLLRVPLDSSDTRHVPLQHVRWWTWCRLLARLRADVCIFAKDGLDAGTWALEAAARLFNRRYVTIEHLACPMPPMQRGRHFGGLVPGAGLWWHATRLRRRLRAPWAHTVVCVSDGVRRPLAGSYGFSRSKVRTVQNGIDVRTFTPALAARRAMRRAWGIPDEALVFGAVGRLNAAKGYTTAVQLFARLTRHASAAGRDLRLVLVGDGPERAQLERMVHEAGLEDRVLLPGFSDRPQDVYPAIDVFVMPSLAEGLPLALAEAMACGCCPIATDVGGVAEVITGPEYGWLVPSGDPDTFFQAMVAATAMDSGQRRGMAERARQRIVQHFDSQVQFAALVNLIEDSARDTGGQR